MIIFFTFLCFFVSTCSARPGNDINPKNVVTVPTNCPNGQTWVNGQCRDIWRVTAAPANVISVPPNCPPGQEYVNGQCRDIWFKLFNEQFVGEIQPNFEETGPQNVVSVPPNCSPNQQWINGSCRDIWRSIPVLDNKNVISVPTNCPAGQEFINGQCRDIWRSSQNLIEIYLNKLKEVLARNERQEENLYELPEEDSLRNVISVPNQCPAGYRPDALGICREIFLI